ncbi:MAG TPA: 16S rRNA (guanine(527)-N(7))-methyltransferase RsmG [Anaeromyxobacter sp.]|nr:16S rRNA (guanine(527)-N(7))-methyltransferase RsmG [Anaeromyxobacter sp.]
MDPAFCDALQRGARALGLSLLPPALSLLERFADRLLAWNQRMSLTAITGPVEVAEKHILDSLSLLRTMGEARSVLDIGSGAGFPGVPLACVRPDLAITCCDSVTKKVAFVKAVGAELKLARLRGVVARAEGVPEREGLMRAGMVVSRALAEPETWLPLGKAYLEEGGTLLAMLGRDVEEERLRRVAAAAGLELVGLDSFELPFSRSARAVARFLRK